MIIIKLLNSNLRKKETNEPTISTGRINDHSDGGEGRGEGGSEEAAEGGGGGIDGSCRRRFAAASPRAGQGKGRRRRRRWRRRRQLRRQEDQRKASLCHPFFISINSFSIRGQILIRVSSVVFYQIWENHLPWENHI